jgi:protein-disulfide isomerase
VHVAGHPKREQGVRKVRQGVSYVGPEMVLHASLCRGLGPGVGARERIFQVPEAGMFRKGDVLLTLGCTVALGLSAAGALRPGAPLRGEIDAWFRARATRKVLKRDWASLAASPDRLGAPSGRARAVVFLDLQCPVCRAEWPILDSVLNAHPDLAIAVRHLPLPMHPAAPAAARAAICAGAEGRFAEMAQELFTHKQWQEDRDWVREALAADISDTVAFRSCLRAPATGLRLARDSAYASQLGVHGTPTFVVPDRVVPGIQRGAALGQLVTELDRSRDDRKGLSTRLRIHRRRHQDDQGRPEMVRGPTAWEEK